MTLEERIGYQFKNKKYLRRALTHSSYSNESKEKPESNERMEFLGDAVLSLVVSNYIFHRFHLDEGDLTKIRASMVCEKSLFRFAQEVGLGEELLEKTADLMGDMFCAPALQDGRLRADYADSERANLIDEIRSIVNDKRVYAARRLLEEMCAGEPYSVRLMGSAEDMERITPEALDSHYRAVLPQGRLELFYCGSAPLERVAGAFTRAFARLPRQGLLEPAATTRRSAPPEPRASPMSWQSVRM